MSPEQEFKENVRLLIQEFGVNAIPRELLHHESERLRAFYVMEKPRESGISLTSHLRIHGIPQAIVDELLETHEDSFTFKSKSKDKYKALDEWVTENVGRQTTVKEITEISGFSSATANKYVQDKINVFHRVKHGIYEIRDPQAEKARELALAR